MYQTIQVEVSRFSIAKDFKCSRTEPTAMLKVIAQAAEVRETKYFSLQTDETTDITVTQQTAIMLRFFDNTQGQVRCVFFALESVERTGEMCLLCPRECREDR